MDFANELLSLNQNHLRRFRQLPTFNQGEALILQGKGLDASAVFKTLVVGHSGRKRRFYELLSEACATMPGQESEQESSVQAWIAWKENLVMLEGLLTKSDSNEVRLVNLLRGDVKTLVGYFQSEEANAWGGKSWPRLLATVLLFHDSSAKKHVLASLSERCASAFPNDDFHEATKAALGGNALKAFQLVFNMDPFSECIMAELMARCKAIESPSLYASLKREEEQPFLVLPEEVDYRQACLFRFAISLAVGPGRVLLRPVLGDTVSLSVALKYVGLATNETSSTYLATRLVRDTLFDRTFMVSEMMARRVVELIDQRSGDSLTIHRRIAAVRTEQLLKEGAYSLACQWASPSRILDFAIASFLHSQLRVKEEDLLSLEASADVITEETRCALNLLKAKCGQQKAVHLVAEAIDSIPLAKRVKVIEKVVLEDKNVNSMSSQDVMRLMCQMAIPGMKQGSKSEAASALLVQAFAKAVTKEAQQQQ